LTNVTNIEKLSRGEDKKQDDEIDKADGESSEGGK
jgi:hypothetical protein